MPCLNWVLHTLQLPVGCNVTAVLTQARPMFARASAAPAPCFTSQLGVHDMLMHLPAGGARRPGLTS